MYAPKKLCFVNCGLPADQCACYRQFLDETFLPTILATEHDRIVAEKDARITVMRKALLAFEQHEASHFRGPDAEKNRRQSYRGVKRAVRAALKGDSDE